MKIFVILCVVLAGALVLVRFMGKQPPQRGLLTLPTASQPLLAARVRPPVLLLPAPDMTLRTAGWRDIRPDTGIAEPGSARLWFAVYDNAQGVCVTALAEATDPWEWDHGGHEPFPVLQAVQYDHAGQTLYESLMVLQAGQNPFATQEEGATLVYRARFVLQFRKMVVLAEYHEPVSVTAARDAALAPQMLDAFRQRGRKACTVRFPDAEEKQLLKEHIRALEPADAVYSRTKLSRWVGGMRRPKDL